MERARRRISSILLFSLTAAALVSSAGTASADDALRIGVIAPLTGPVSAYGVDAVRMLQILPEVLRKERVSTRFEFLVEEGRCGKGNAALTAAQKLLAIDGVKFFVVGCSGEMLQTASLLEQRRAVAVCYACSHPDIKKLGDRTFRTYPDISGGVDLLVTELTRRNFTRVGILTSENAFTSAIEKLLRERLGGRIAATQNVMPDDRDFRSVILKFISVNADALYLNVVDPEGYIAVMRQLRELGFKGKLFGYYMPKDQDAREALGEKQNGVVFIDSPDVAEGHNLFSKVRQLYVERFKENPRNDYLLLSSLNAALAIVRAIESAGSDPSEVREALVSGVSGGAEGDLRFDKNGDLLGTRYVLREIVRGEPAPVTE